MGNTLSINSNSINFLFLADSYKVSHHVQYPKNTTKIYSYFESRGGRHEELCWFGLQILIKRFFCGKVVTKEKIEEAEYLYKLHFGQNSNIFNKKGWEHILKEHGGMLPIKIKSLPEGTIIKNKNCMFTIENTDPECYWLTNFCETILSHVWYTMTVATNSREQKKIILRYLKETGTPEEVNFKLHDFGYRGVSSLETAAYGAASHLTQFAGTDTIAGIKLAQQIYGARCAGFSIPASEHSTITPWENSCGVDDNGDTVYIKDEKSAIENMIDQYPHGLVSCVCDSFNIYNTAEHILGEVLKEKIMKRDGCFIVRPDSGDPLEVDLKLLEILGDKFGYETNEKGYKVLDPHIRIIQGDGIDIIMLEKILEHLKKNGWSADNIAFGSGGGLLQKLNRDTQKCAMKCSLAIIDGREVMVYKNPITDPGKKSKKGYMTVNKNSEGKLITKCNGEHDFDSDEMETVFENGELLINYTWDSIKERCNLTEDMV
jgi:nicotinamide phosphoribosyltransferase